MKKSKLLPSDLKTKISDIRLYVDEKFNNFEIINRQLEISNNDFEYLIKVMRRKVNDKIIIFDGFNGDYLANIIKIDKKSLTLQIIQKIAELKTVPNITLAFAPVKNVRIDFIASKACELGVKTFQPIITQRTIINKINYERFFSNIKEAIEQCGRNDIPQILPIVKLEKFLAKNIDDKILILADESGRGDKARDLFPNIKIQPQQEIIVFIGPEGGFSNIEFERFRQIKNCYALNLGPRILRADTAMISALTLVQEFLGDFKLKANFS